MCRDKSGFGLSGFFFSNNPIYSIFEKYNLIKRQQLDLSLKFSKCKF